MKTTLVPLASGLATAGGLLEACTGGRACRGPKEAGDCDGRDFRGFEDAGAAGSRAPCAPAGTGAPKDLAC